MPYSATTAGARCCFEQRIDDGVGVDRHAVVVTNRFEPADQMGGKLGAQDSVELSVAVLLDDVDAVVTLHERRDLRRERQRAHAHVVELDSRFAQKVARLDDGVMRRAVREDRDLACLSSPRRPAPAPPCARSRACARAGRDCAAKRRASRSSAPPRRGRCRA